MDLGEVVYQELGLSRNECSDLVDDFFDIITAELSKGNKVKISGFGTFALIDKAQRIGRNPKTGEEVIISPRKVISFKASQHLKDVVNK
jgi:integration host factor subunit alpha